MTDDVAAFLDAAEARAGELNGLAMADEITDIQARTLLGLGADALHALVRMVRSALVDCDNLRAENACLRRERDLAIAKVRAEDRIVLGD